MNDVKASAKPLELSAPVSPALPAGEEMGERSQCRAATHAAHRAASKGRPRFGALRGVLRWTANFLLMTLIVAVVALGAGWKAYGLRYMPILTPSMSPVMPQGSLAVTKPIDPKDIREGDVIAFIPPSRWAPKDGKPVVHRVHQLNRYSVSTAMQTKGDANPGVDPWTINLSGQGTYAKVATIIPKAGGIAQLLTRGGPLVLVSGLGGLLLAGYGLRRLVPEVVRPIQRRRRNR
ncbi:signal peptidase I [Streptomyces olivoreticuli]